MSKKRAFAQRVGARGENEFRNFAERHRLVPNKVEQDYGTDFLCQVEGRPNQAGVAIIKGGLIGAFVRSTTSRRARIQIDRGDAEHLLSCDYPIAVVLIHLAVATPQCHASFVDEELGEALGKFLLSEAATFTITPTLLAVEANFDGKLRDACRAGFVEQVRLALASTRFRHVIPKGRIQVRRTSGGGLTLVHIDNFFSQYDHRKSASRERIYSAVFGHSSQFEQRLRQVPVRQDLLAAVARLPNPIVIGGPVVSKEYNVEVVGADKKSVTCAFEARDAAGHTGWVHRCGFAITVSNPEQYEGEWVHVLQAHADPDVEVELFEHEDLQAFLAMCDEGAGLRLRPDDEHIFPVAQLGNLTAYGAFARYLATLHTIHSWPRGTWFLSDVEESETLVTLGFLETLATAPDRLGSFGFALGPEVGETVEEQHAVWAPIVVNLPRAGLVAWIRTTGTLLSEPKGFAGFRFGAIEEIRLDVRLGRFKKSALPEVVYHPKHRSVPIIGSEKELNANRSDATSWECTFLSGDGEPTILGRLVDLK